MPWETVAMRLSLALLLGIMVGLERQLRQNTAGLRMNSLVSIGAASFVLFGNSVALGGISTPDSLARISSQIVTGIGFLGGGVIMREGASIKGIATAATLWCSAAIGMFSGAGLFSSAIACALFIVATNLLLRPLAWSIKKRIDMPHLTRSEEPRHLYNLSVTCENRKQDFIRAMLLQQINSGELHLRKLESRSSSSAESVEINVDVASAGSNEAVVERMVTHLSLQPAVTTASWSIGKTT